jgi:HEPN domain-containing protein
MKQSAKLAKLLLQKAAQDRYAMNHLLDDPLAPNEVVGFHAQQAVEKLVKAVLSQRSVEYQRTHQLQRLVTLLQNAGISYPPELLEAVALTPFAVEFRYDLLPIRDDAAPPFDRQWAKHCVERIAVWAASVVETANG